VHHDRVSLLVEASPAFTASPSGVRLSGHDAAARTQALTEAIDRLGRAGELRAPLGEPYAVLDRATHEPLAVVDRVAVPWLGLLARGVHLNGYVRTPTGPQLWIARRATGKRTFAGHLDNVVAGGQAAGYDARQTLVKECAEEAGIPSVLAERAVPVGSIGYVQQDGASLKVDLLACFDLELPAGFVPRPVDGEVESFELWPAAVVAASLRGDDPWKPNCALVALDFLLRHGRLDSELDAGERHRLWRSLHGG
jgi:8-oxo-dGTP pyrophosphatase MutT (NUDIX family)